MKNRLALASSVMLSLAAGLPLAIGGCGRAHSAKPPAYVYVIDYSGSTEGARKRHLGLMVQELESAPAETEVVVYRMGRETQEVFSGRLGDEGADALAGVIKRDLMASDHRKGTDLAKMAEALATFSKRFKGDAYKLRIMTDGGNDFADPANRSLMRREMGVVMNDRRLSSTVLYGVLPPFRRSMREAFGERVELATESHLRE